MAIEDPVAVYDAANNAEAQLIKVLLVESGVEACAIDDVSTVGFWMLGILPVIHKPQVFVNRCDRGRAEPILKEYEAQAAARNKRSRDADTLTASPIDVVCEECDGSTSFPASQRGSVQICPRCGAHVDVGEVDVSWFEQEDGGSP